MNIHSVNPSVIIVGAGPIGLMMGNLLGMAGIDTLILECNAGLSDCPKAIALDDEGLRICQAVGLGDAVIGNLLLDIEAHYVSAGRVFAKVAPTGKRNGYPLISTFHQPEFEATLLDGLKRFACVKMWFERRVETFKQTEDGVIVAVRTADGSLQEIACSYLLACDGAKSTIRRALGISMDGTTFAQKWLVVDCVDDEDPCAVATFFCNPGRPAVTVPAPHKGRRWEFMLLPGEKEEELLHAEKVRALMQENGGSVDAHIVRQTVYTFHATLAKSFSKGRAFLLGDAAHLMPPFGGQGMNSGLRDVQNLSWKLELVLQGLASPALLNSYHEERYAHTAQMIWLSSLLGSIVMPTARSIAVFRDMLFRILYAIPATHEFLIEARLKPQPRYKRGFMLSGGERDKSRPYTSRPYKALVGRMLPQPEVITSEGKRVLLDEVLGRGFALLRLYDDATRAFAGHDESHPYKAEVWRRLGVRCICVQPSTAGVMMNVNKLIRICYDWSMSWFRGQGKTVYLHRGVMNHARTNDACTNDVPMSDGCVVVGDVQGEMSKFLLHDRGLFVLVRPDRYVFGVFREEQADEFALAFQRLLDGSMDR